EVMRETSHLLSALTGQAALVLPPRLESVALERVNFVRMRPRQVLALFVPVSGGVQSRLVDTEEDHGQEELDRMARFLNDWLCGRTLESARHWIEQALKEERARYDRVARAALTLGDAVVKRPASSNLIVEGSAKALEQPE